MDIEEYQKISNEWIAKQIDRLWDRIPYKPNKQSFMIDPIVFYNILDCKDRVRFLIKRFSLPIEEIKIYLHADLKGAGKVELRRVFDTKNIKQNDISIYLNQDYINYKEEMGCIIAHEISHLYLHFSGIQKLKSKEDIFTEYITDIAAFIIGLGVLMINGSGVRKRIIKKGNEIIMIEQRLGYLTTEQMRFVQEQVLNYLQD